jgi:IS30 family transposase
MPEQVFLCDPQNPWQRGSNRNTNRLFRQYLPKETDLSICTQAQLNGIEQELKERPRKTLDFETPADRFNACVAATANQLKVRLHLKGDLPPLMLAAGLDSHQ